MAKGHRRVYIARIRGANDSWNSSLVMLSGSASGSRIPTIPLQQSARCSRSAGDGAADGGGRVGSHVSRFA